MKSPVTPPKTAETLANYIMMLLDGATVNAQWKQVVRVTQR